MNIQYYGDYCFKLTTKPGGRATEDIIIWTDPYDASIGLRAPQGQADIVFLSHANKVDTELSNLRGDFVSINTPGEYAVKDVNVFGIPSFQDTESGAVRGQNTIFVFQVESMSICFLGALGHELTASQVEKIGAVDILFAPIGNSDTIATKQIDELIRKIEPSIIIPMHYQIEGANIETGDEKSFCNEIGNCPAEKVAKFNLKKKDLEGKSMEIVFLERA